MTLERLQDRAPRPDPVVHPEVEPFWAGLAAGELRVQRCTSCGTRRTPFAPVCFACRSFGSLWEAISPDGTVAAAVVVHRATGHRAWSGHVPFLSGLVDLEDALRLPGRIVCTCGEAARRGTAVRAVVIEAPESISVYAFAHSCITAKPG